MCARVSVLICTAGRPQLLGRALDSLAAGTRRPDQLVIVNGGDDTANEVVARHAARFPEVVLLQYQNENLSVSRNLGLPECTGDIIAMTDDDAVVYPTWIESIVAAHERDEGVGAVGGPVHGARNDRFLSRLADRVVFPSFSTQRQVRTLPGVNVAYKRHVVQQVGAFDETLFRGEDVDFNWRLIRLGYHITYHPDIEVNHAHRDTFMGLLQQQWMYGRAYVLVRRKWQDMYCVYPRRLHSPQDWAKALYCALAVLFHPALAARRMGGMRDQLLAYPLLVVHHATWKLGMLRQALAIGWGSSQTPGTVRPTLPPIRLRQSWRDGMPAPLSGAHHAQRSRAVTEPGDGMSTDSHPRSLQQPTVLGRGGNVDERSQMAVETRHPERAQAPSDLSALHIGYAVAEGGGAETFVRQVARFLVLSGHRVTVLYIGYPGQPQRPPAIEDGVHIEYVGITNLHYFYSRVQSLRPSTVGQMLSSGAVKAAEQSFALRRALQCITRVRGAFDLIEVPEGTILPTLFRRLAPYAVKLHSSESTWRHFCNEGLGQEDFQRFRLESTLLHGAVCVSAPSAAVADHVAAMCTFPRSRIEIVPNLVDVDRFRPGNLPAQEKDSVLYVGRLDPRKGLRSLALAAEAVLLGSPAATIDIVGGETDEVTAESFLGDVPASLRHRVRFHGRIPYDRLLSYYRRAGVVVVPSRWDNSPLTIYEAMACGVPVVATNVGGIPELVEDGETGLLIPHDDPGALAGAVLSLLRAPRRRTEMGLRARSIAEGKYAPAAVADVTARMYRTALHRRTAVSGAAIMT